MTITSGSSWNYEDAIKAAIMLERTDEEIVQILERHYGFTFDFPRDANLYKNTIDSIYECRAELGISEPSVKNNKKEI